MYFQRGRLRVLTPEYREYKNRVKEIFKEERINPETKSIAVKIDYIVPDKRKRDIDNIIKPLLDGITQSGFWEDDSLVKKLLVTKLYIKGQQGLIVEIAEIE